MLKRIIMVIISIIAFLIASARLEENNKNITKGSEDFIFICVAIQLMSIGLILIGIFMK